jgi:hypothetical protein
MVLFSGVRNTSMTPLYCTILLLIVIGFVRVEFVFLQEFFIIQACLCVRLLEYVQVKSLYRTCIHLKRKPIFYLCSFFVPLCQSFVFTQCICNRLKSVKLKDIPGNNTPNRIVVILSLGTWPTRTNLHDPFPTSPLPSLPLWI